MTPILSGTVWLYNDRLCFILNSKVNQDKTWEIEALLDDDEYVIMTVTQEEWLSKAKYISDK